MATKTKEHQAPSPSESQTEAHVQTPGERIQDVSHGFRLSFAGLSRTKTVKEKVQQEIADEYDADADALRTIKKLIPASHASVKALQTAKGKVVAYFYSRTIPFPEKGVRLFCSRSADAKQRATEVDQFLNELQVLIGDYYRAAAELDENWQSVLSQAQREQGKLFDEADYPASVKDTLHCKLYPYNVDIPDYYRRLSTRHYQEARQMLQSRFEEAARMQETVVAKAMHEAVERLAASVTGFHDGTQKTFKNTVVENVFEAIKQFDETARAYGIGGEDLAKAFDDLETVLRTDGSGRTIRPQDVAEELRRDKDLAAKTTAAIMAMGQQIAELASVAPRRVLARRAASA